MTATADSSPRLYAVYLGGALAPGRMGEDHEVVFVVATDDKAARQRARTKWQGHRTPRPHVDAVVALDAVDGYAVRLEPTSCPDELDIDPTYHRAD